MRRTLIVAAIVVAFQAFGGNAGVAGFKEDDPVSVASTFAFGSIGSARNSADTRQYMIVSLDTGAVAVQAADSTGTTFSCHGTHQNLKEVMKGASEDAYVYVESDGAGNCTYLELDTASWAPPKKP
jgi:hypothetical protein